jgi:hypothetical protein
MQTGNDNLFNALFRFHPRDGYSPWENFLSEAFAYNLRTVEGACDAWCSRVAGTPVALAEWEIFTRNAEHDAEADSTVFPDLKIKGVTTDGEPFYVWSEHKWDSPCNRGQLEAYARLAAKAPGKNLLAFVGAHPKQIGAAKSAAGVIPCVALSWEDAYTSLLQFKEKSEVLAEFLHFMETHGLSPGEPISTRKMQAYLDSAGFIDQLWQYAEKLLAEYEWPLIPKRYTEETGITKRWGRVAIEFPTKNWAPTITLGFLCSAEEHEVTFTAPETGIDLLLRIETDPGRFPNPIQALDALKEKAAAVRAFGARVLLKNQPGNGNPHSLLIAQKALGKVIEGAPTRREQLGAIHAELSKWIEALFGDGELEPALQTIVG